MASDALLTSDEHDAVRLCGELWNLISGKVIGDGPTRRGDVEELAVHIHAIQQSVLSQAAARAYPDRYRLLGHTLPGVR